MQITDVTWHLTLSITIASWTARPVRLGCWAPADMMDWATGCRDGWLHTLLLPRPIFPPAHLVAESSQSVTWLYVSHSVWELGHNGERTRSSIPVGLVEDVHIDQSIPWNRSGEEKQMFWGLIMWRRWKAESGQFKSGKQGLCFFSAIDHHLPLTWCQVSCLFAVSWLCLAGSASSGSAWVFLLFHPGLHSTVIPLLREPPLPTLPSVSPHHHILLILP